MFHLLASLTTFAAPLVGVALWLFFCWWAQRVVHNPRRAGDIASGLAWRLVIVYCRLFHWMRIIHRRNIPAGPVVGGVGGVGGVGSRPIVVVANHTAGVDPLLIQAALPFYVRWMMAADMRAESLEGLWSFLEVISIDRSGKADMAGVRKALDTLAAGGALGIFPEGKLRTARHQLHEFLPGVGLIVSRADALVLPIVITGTPMMESSWASLWTPSAARVRVMPLIDFKAEGIRAGGIAPDLRRRYVQWLAEDGEAVMDPPIGPAHAAPSSI
jgi:1-acyl-sn-glycerol-3-phosphate acyltransferase